MFTKPMERSKKKVHLWKKATVHFILCFVMGFFIGFAPTDRSSFSSHSVLSHNRTELAPASSHQQKQQQSIRAPRASGNFNRSLAETVATTTTTEPSDKEDETNYEEEKHELEKTTPRRQIIVITPTSDKDCLRGVLLRRLASTLKLVPPPLLWIVVESNSEGSDVSGILRKTGVMYRHLVTKENFTDPRVEMDYQRNIALNHIENHRLSGIVHFAGLSNVYDLRFFEEIRAIEVFGTWQLAKLSPKRKNTIIEGPVCTSSQVVGWHLKNQNNQQEGLPIHISNFGFNSSILWDPERWGRLSSAQNTKQDSLKFVRQAVFEDETKLKGVPQEDCSKVNLWQLHLSTKTIPIDKVPKECSQIFFILQRASYHDCRIKMLIELSP